MHMEAIAACFDLIVLSFLFVLGKGSIKKKTKQQTAHTIAGDILFSSL